MTQMWLNVLLEPKTIPRYPVYNPAWQQPELAAWQRWFQSMIACIPHHRWKRVLKTEGWDWGDWMGVNTLGAYDHSLPVTKRDAGLSSLLIPTPHR
jgi:hypothetical protein